MVAVQAAWSVEVFVNDNISTSVTWTSDNVYNLQKQIYVLPGATLTIEPGTLVQSTAGVGGSLAVCRGGKIYVNGTQEEPVIMTSTNDTLTSWHEGANEWGNLTIMGRGLISASHYGGQVVGSNTKEPTGLNEKQMEGLTAAYPGDPNVMYGGNDDDDDSGSIRYLSLRYGGKVIGLANELNGLSLGAVGRETDIDHVEIMNNVDDGIEIWGGTVNLKYLNIWNVGDDSLDVDEGWRGKAQFGLIVQGYSLDASQGSGVGDNCFETDGAEDSDAQPVTTATIYNFTIVGQPVDGDQGTAWRDNARVQYRNCIFMDLGEKLVKNDNTDGDGGNGYGYNGTLSWDATWATDYSVTSFVNAGTWTAGAFNDPAVMYTSQTSGKLAEISDSVFYNNLFATAYTDAESVGVLDATANNVIATNNPIKGITRGQVELKGGKTMLRVTNIDPRAWNSAVASVSKAPEDGFFTPAKYRGGFPFYNNWLEGWTAADSYGLTDTSGNLTAEELGDVGSSKGTTITDALLIAQYVAGLRTADDPVFTNLEAGDVNGVGGITITDALLIAQYAAGLRDSLGKKKSITKAAASVLISPGVITVDPHVSGAFTIGVDSGLIPVGAYDIDLSWTPGVFTINSVTAGSSTEFGTPIANIDNEAGILKVTGFQFSSLSQPTGSFSVANINYTSGASGSTMIVPVVEELSDTSGTLFTPTASSAHFTVNNTSTVNHWNLY